MSPFDLPPSTPPVSLDPPEPTPPPSGRRRRTVAVLVAVGLAGGGAIGVSRLVSADEDPSIAAAPADDDTGDGTGDGTGDEGADDPDVEIVIGHGDDPIVIDLDAADAGALEELGACLGLDDVLPPFDGEFPEPPWAELDVELDGPLADIELFHDGTHITVVGPDGVSVIDLGDGDASVTVTREDGELSIETEGSAAVIEVEDLFGEIVGELPELDELVGELPDWFDELEPAVGEMWAELPTPDEIEECLERLDDD